MPLAQLLPSKKVLWESDRGHQDIANQERQGCEEIAIRIIHVI